MKNILVGLDLKETDRALLYQAGVIAARFESRVWLVHVAAPDPDFVGYEPGPKYIRDTRAEELREEHRLLQEYTADLRNKSIGAEGLLIQGPTIEMITEEVRKLNIDLLILGNHKRGLLYEAFIGHTAEKILKEVEIPVLIVPLKEK